MGSAGDDQLLGVERFQPGGLWSLADVMKNFFASGIMSVVRATASINVTDGEVEAQSTAHFVTVLKSYDETFVTLGLAASRATAQKIIALLAKSPPPKWGELKELCEELCGRLIDEAKDKTFLMMTLRESEIFLKPRAGWETAIDRFDTIVSDVEEASRCFALSRYAAAVFHSIQAVEAGLIELGRFLKVADPHSGWTAVSIALNKVTKANHKDRTRFERKNFAFLEQVHGTVEGLKNAWRNKISHAHGKLTLMTTDFSPEVAEEILFASRAFMRRLAEGLPPPKKKPGAIV